MTRHARSALLALVAALGVAASAGAAAPPPGDADELAALSDGGWLALGPAGLRLIGADGRERDRHALRGESLDLRPRAGGALALLIDANTQQVLPVHVDLAAGRLRVAPPLPPAGRTLSAACLHRDAQGHDHVFVIAENGLATQWVLRGDDALALRELAVAPEVGHCRVDDAGGWLLVSEPGGVWAHRADPEGKPGREAVALHRPAGAIVEGGGPLALLPAGVAVGDAGASALRVFVREPRSGRWTARAPITLKPGSRPERLASGHAPARLLVRDDRDGRWRSRGVPAALQRHAAPPGPAVPVLRPLAQTDPVASHADAADDPAIWVHPVDRSRSLVLGTDKTRGLGVYGLDGGERQFLAVGRLNNVDVRQDVQLGTRRVDLAAASQRDDLSVVIFLIDAEGRLAEAARLPTGLPDIYGLCLYRAADGQVDVIVNDKSGRFLQLRVEESAGRIQGRLRREFSVASQPEGCVADDVAGRLFVGEEKAAVWTLPAEPAADGRPARLTEVLRVGTDLKADIEGLAIARGPGAGYLLVSSQGDHRYVVLDAAPPFRVRGSFRIGMNLAAGIDGTSETDGLEVLTGHFGPDFPAGLLVVQDGHKRLPEGPQNFKLLSWADVQRALGLD